MFSIDQNCHPLWDVVPKLHALTRHGHCIRHFIEDVDVAFTAVGATVGDNALRFEPERFYASGGSDWGAAVFYSQFLSTQPTELRHWESYTHTTTAALARRLGMTVATLYDRYSPSGNIQLVGPSYVNDSDHHRLIGDLRVAELADHLRRLLAMAREDCLTRFPAADSQVRLQAWFDREAARLEDLLTRHAAGLLVELYRDWLGLHVNSNVTIDTAGSLFTLGANSDQLTLLDRFVTDYDTMAAIYADAMAEGDNGLHPLHTGEGELPFFAAFHRNSRYVRATCYLQDDAIAIAGRTFPLEDGHIPIRALRDVGVVSLVGKAALLVIQARLGAQAQPLVLPYHGSSYMPSAFALERKLRAAGVIGTIQPVMRVRLNMLSAMATLKTPVRLPEYLAPAFGQGELPACELAARHQDVIQQAVDRLDLFAAPAGRSRWLEEAFPQRWQQRDALDRERRRLAQDDSKDPHLRQLSHQVRAIDDELFAAFVDQLWLDWQVSQLDFWDTRGAPLPWCVGLGGEEFYQHVIEQATIYEDDGTHP